MEKVPTKNRYWPFAEQLPELCEGMLDKLWMSEQMAQALSVGSCFDARKIVLTGSGIGYAAALAAAPIFTGHCDIFFGTAVEVQADFNYFNNVAAMGIGEPNTPLVILPTEFEDDPDAAHTLEMARKAGANSLLICAGKHSAQADLACNVICLGLDSSREDFLARAYLGLTLALVSAAYRIGRVRGTVSELELNQTRQRIAAYLQKASGQLDAFEGQGKAFAALCKDRDRFDYIADAEAQGPAHFLGTVGARVLGLQYAVNDSEEWCHVNYWMEDRFDLCTVMWGLKEQPSFSRAIETMGCVHKLERPYLFVTDADPGVFLEGTRCCEIPGPEERWMVSLISYLPALLAFGELEQEAEKEGA